MSVPHITATTPPPLAGCGLRTVRPLCSASVIFCYLLIPLLNCLMFGVELSMEESIKKATESKASETPYKHLAQVCSRLCIYPLLCFVR